MPSNLDTDETLNELESILINSRWVTGDKLTSADKEALEMLTYSPNPDSHPHTFAWWSLINRSTPAIRDSWPKAPARPSFLDKERKEAKP